MEFQARLLRALCVPASLLLAGAAPVNVAPLQPQKSMPPLMWQQAGPVRILCLVAPATRPDARLLQEEICDSIRALAADGAPVEVSRVGFGDPAVLEPGTVTLLVHASVQDDGKQRLVALDVRPFRPGGDHHAILFGAAPRAVRIPGSGPGGDKLEAALAAALAETLPWRQGR